MSRLRLRVGAAMLFCGALFVCAACAGLDAKGVAPPAAETSAQARESFVIQGVPFLPQEEETCGPSSLAMLLRHFGSGAAVADLVRETRTPALKGVLITDLAAAARRRGFEAEVVDLDVVRLGRILRGGTPVILLVDLGRWVFSRPHFLLAYGVTPGGIIAHSGRDEGRVFPLAALDAAWAKMGRLALVVRRGNR